MILVPRGTWKHFTGTRATVNGLILYSRQNWITPVIIKSCVTKLYKLWKKHSNNTKKRENYRKFNLILKKIINIAKESFDKEQKAKMIIPKSLWNVINQKLG